MFCLHNVAGWYGSALPAMLYPWNTILELTEDTNWASARAGGWTCERGVVDPADRQSSLCPGVGRAKSPLIRGV